MIEALGNKVIISREENKKTEGGIIIPNEKKQNAGTVKSIGPEVKQLYIGDKVIWSGYSGFEIDHAGEKLLIMKDEDVCARIT